MKASVRQKLAQTQDRLAELDRALADGDIARDPARLQALGRERAEIEPVASGFAAFCAAETALREAEALREDAELRELAEAEIPRLQAELVRLEEELQRALLPRDPDDGRDVFLEIRAGTGGDEAALFAGDLLRMYLRYAQSRGWQTEAISASEAELGGYKEVVVRISGHEVYGRLKFESGAHRVQRVPATEAQGRIHTSACTVAVLPQAEELDDIELPAEHLRIDTFRASGAGGQHINKTDSAVRITHLPTGLVVECQDDRSQHRNRAQALAVLAARLRDRQQQEAHAKEAATRKQLVGSGDRSERIRTYNFPQGRVTDHRINLTVHKLDAILSGELNEVLDALALEHQASLIAELAA